MKKVCRTAALLLVLCLLFLIGCGDVSDGSSTADGKGLTKDGLMQLVDLCVSQGDRFSKLLMDETAAYFYGFAGSAVGSMRLAAERLLWLKGEGEDFESLSAGSRYTNWNTLGELCFASPYPYYFEGLIYDVQGMTEEANDAYAKASIMDNFPDDGLNFYYLKDMSVTDLYALRDELRTAENKIYQNYTPVIYGYERSVFASSPEYLILDAYELLENENYESAMIPARYALRENPKIEESWIVAVTAAMYADKPHQAALWLEEGLKYFPESEGLGVFSKALNDMNTQAAAEGGGNG